MGKTVKDKEFSSLLYRAWLRDGGIVHTGESLLIACLLHAKGSSRRSDAMKDVQRIMRDVNLPPKPIE